MTGVSFCNLEQTTHRLTPGVQDLSFTPKVINKPYFNALQQPRKFNKNNKFIKNANFYTVTSAIPSRSLIGWLEFQRTNI